MTKQAKILVFIISVISVGIGTYILKLSYPLAYVVVLIWAIYSSALLERANYSKLRVILHFVLVVTLPIYIATALTFVDKS